MMQAQLSEPTAAVVNDYLSAFYSGDFDRARPLLDDAFDFAGPFLQVHGRDAFLAGAEGLRAIVRGHRLLRQWHADGQVCSFYELSLETPAARGSVLMSEWHSVRGGRITAGRVVFDSAAFRALVPAAV